MDTTMNKKERTKARTENIKKYHTPGCQNYVKRAKNAVFISPSNSLKHELKKLEVCYELREQGNVFITEAVRNKKEDGKDRRVDVVNLDTCDEIEIETDKKVCKPGAITIYI